MSNAKPGANIMRARSQRLLSPDGRVEVIFALVDGLERAGVTCGCPVWQVLYDGQSMLRPSCLGLGIGDAFALAGGFELREVLRRHRNRTRPGLHGESAKIVDRYREMIVRLREIVEPQRQLELQIRCYNEGAAIRYFLPLQPDLVDVVLSGEGTEFQFPNGTDGYVKAYDSGVYQRQALAAAGKIREDMQTLVYPHGKFGWLLYAGGDVWPDMQLAPIPGGWAAQLVGSMSLRLPVTSPWRALMVADRPADLPMHRDFAFNLGFSGVPTTQVGIAQRPDGRHNCTMPFVRYPVDKADYTPCYDTLNFHTTHAHQLALPLIFFSPQMYCGWQDRPPMTPDRPELDLWNHLPRTWDETRYLRGEIGEFIVVARRSGAQWFVAGITGPAGRVLTVRFEDFMSVDASAGSYRLHLHRDALKNEDGGGTGVVTEVFDALTVDDKVRLELPVNGGFAMRLEPAALSATGAM